MITVLSFLSTEYRWYLNTMPTTEDDTCQFKKIRLEVFEDGQDDKSNKSVKARLEKAPNVVTNINHLS